MNEPALWGTQQLSARAGSLSPLSPQQQMQWLASKRRLLTATALVTTSLAVLGAGEVRSYPPPHGAATGCQLAALLRALPRWQSLPWPAPSASYGTWKKVLRTAASLLALSAAGCACRRRRCACCRALLS